MKTLLIILIVFIFITSKASNIPDSLDTNTDLDIHNFTDVYNKLISMNCAFPIESTAKGILENGWVLGKSNNLFGMHIPKSRATTNIAKSGIKAKYENKTKSIVDLLLWQSDTRARKSKDYLSHLMRCGYNTKSNYIIELRRIIDSERFKKIITRKPIRRLVKCKDIKLKTFALPSIEIDKIIIERREHRENPIDVTEIYTRKKYMYLIFGIYQNIFVSL